MKHGKLMGVGVGPGDPELLTLKAARMIREADVVAVPVTAEEKESVALSIARGVTDHALNLMELHFPMSRDAGVLQNSWDKAARQLQEEMDKGHTVVFLTLGDPTVYSTYMYVHARVREAGYDTEIVPGITSFCASAARAGVSLAENSETLVVVPSAYEEADLQKAIESHDNAVFMKVARQLPRVQKVLGEMNLLDNAVLVTRCGFPDERIQRGLRELPEEPLSYFTTMIVRKNGLDGGNKV